VTLAVEKENALEPCPWIPHVERCGMFHISYAVEGSSGCGTDSVTVEFEIKLDGSNPATPGIDYYLSNDPNGWNTITIDSNKKGNITVPANDSIVVYVVPIEDSIFEVDEKVTMALTGEYTSADGSESGIKIDVTPQTVTIHQAPEFISDVDKAAIPSITKDNYVQHIPFAITADSYHGYVNRNAQIGTAIVTATPIFAANNRGVKYSFVLGDNTNYTIGQTLYRKPDGEWSLKEKEDGSNENNVPLFTINVGSGEIKTATDFRKLTIPPNSWTFTIQAACPVHALQYDRASVTVNLCGINIAIDADNDNGVFGGPNNTEWEHFIKDHLYGVGKVFPPNHGDQDGDGIRDCWDGFTLGSHTQIRANASAPFVPIEISMPEGTDVSDLCVHFQYEGPTAIVIPTDLTSIPNVSPGSIRIWKKDGPSPRYGAMASSSSNGDFVGKGYYHKATDLGFSGNNNTVTLYLEGLTENENVKYYDDVQTGAKQGTKIVVELAVSKPDGSKMTLASDTAKYVVAKTDTFYYLMATKQDVRAAVASALIYGSGDPSKFGLHPAGYDPITNFGFDLAQYVTITAASNTDFLNAGVYFDYCSRKCLVTFQGTDPLLYEHWEANAGQYFFGKTSQYTMAMNIGLWIHEKEINAPGFIDKVIFTGHSLGGGLASAATVLAIPEGYSGGKKAFTFNAAALQRATVKKFIDDHDVGNNGRSLCNYDNRDMDIVLAFIVKGEMLDTFQSAFPPRAFGGKQQLEHNYWLKLINVPIIPSIFLDPPVATVLFGINRIRLHKMGPVLKMLERFYGVRQ